LKVGEELVLGAPLARGHSFVIVEVSKTGWIEATEAAVH
jgi:hypothetical protein